MYLVQHHPDDIASEWITNKKVLTTSYTNEQPTVQENSTMNIKSPAMSLITHNHFYILDHELNARLPY